MLLVTFPVFRSTLKNEGIVPGVIKFYSERDSYLHNATCARPMPAVLYNLPAILRLFLF